MESTKYTSDSNPVKESINKISKPNNDFNNIADNDQKENINININLPENKIIEKNDRINDNEDNKSMVEIEEPLLQETVNRFVIFPLVYPELYDFYLAAEGSFWVIEDIDFSFAETSSLLRKIVADKLLYNSTIFSLISLIKVRSIYPEEIVTKITTLFSATEVRFFYSYKIMIENVHRETLGKVFEKLVSFRRNFEIENKLALVGENGMTFEEESKRLWKLVEESEIFKEKKRFFENEVSFNFIKNSLDNQTGGEGEGAVDGKRFLEDFILFMVFEKVLMFEEFLNLISIVEHCFSSNANSNTKGRGESKKEEVEEEGEREETSVFTNAISEALIKILTDRRILDSFNELVFKDYLLNSRVFAHSENFVEFKLRLKANLKRLFEFSSKDKRFEKVFGKFFFGFEKIFGVKDLCDFVSNACERKENEEKGKKGSNASSSFAEKFGEWENMMEERIREFKPKNENNKNKETYQKEAKGEEEYAITTDF